MSKILRTYLALEEFTEEVNATVAAPEPTADDVDFEGEIDGVPYQEESTAIDTDVDSIVKGAQGLEDIISLVESAPGADEANLEPFVEKSVNLALESNEMVEAAGNPVEGSDDKTKAGVLGKIKEFAARVWEMLRKFGARISEWVKGTWAKFTDTIVKNAAQADKILASLESLQVAAGAKITDSGLLAKIATPNGLEVGEVMQSVTSHVRAMGGKAAEEITREARVVINAVADGSEKADAVMADFVEILRKAAGEYDEKASPEQASKAGASEGAEVLVSDPFFGGYRAWIVSPADAADLGKWKHGITKVDEVQATDSIDAPNPDEIKAIALYVKGLGEVVKIFQGAVKNLDDLNKDLDAAAGKAKNSDKADKEKLKAMQAVIPRILKGPQVDAYAYAANASTIALAYCAAGVRAHKGEKSVGDHVDNAKAQVGKAADKVKGAFKKDGE